MTTETILPGTPDHWQELTLGEACARGGGNIQTGPFGSQLHASDYVEVGIPSIMPKNIGNNRIDEDGIARITKEDADRLSRYLVRDGDIVYSRRGDVERSALVRPSESGWLCGTGCLRVRVGQGSIYPQYAAYYLRHPFVRAWVVRHAIGATMPNLNTTILSSVPLVMPPMAEQRAIAHILGTLDDKIEINRKMNDTLEAMARAIFKSWFVDFDPVRAKAEGRQPVGMSEEIAALFPDSFEECALGQIPTGWSAGTVGDIGVNHRNTIKPEQIDPATPYIGLEHMPRGSLSLGEWGAAGNVMSNKFQFGEGQILFGKLRPYFHKVGPAPLDGVCSTDVLVVSASEPVWTGFLLAQLSSREFIAYVNASSTGTRMPRTNWKDMSRYPLVLPDVGTVAVFEGTFANPFLNRMRLNIHESRTLENLRDTLLPKLLSGEIRVGGVENQVVELV